MNRSSRASAESDGSAVRTETPHSAGELRLPRELTREMWAACGDAIVALPNGGACGHDLITAAVWQALQRFAAPSWQPIESAPRDGTVFLAWGPLHECMTVFLGDESGLWLTPDGPGYGNVFTHWMPLPDPPAGEP